MATSMPPPPLPPHTAASSSSSAAAPASPLTPPPRPMLPRSQVPRTQSQPSPAGAVPARPPTAHHPLSLPTSSAPSSSRAPLTSASSTESTAPSTTSAMAPPPPAAKEKYPKEALARMANASSSSSASLVGLGVSGVHTQSQALAAAPTATSGTSTPQTGASKMAAAAKARQAGGVPVGRGESFEGEDESHPLSDKSLKARDYQTILTHGRLFHLPQRWELIRPLGQGAYGLVISVKDTLSGEPVAVKCITKVFDKVILAKRALREITLLRHFAGHENITGLIDLDNVWHGYNEVYLYMEPMEADLHQIVRSGQALSNTHIQYFLYQLLRGMKYIHTADVIHRDLKPGNLLVNSDCELKICDFGLARGYRPVTGEQDQNEAMRLTEYVATRWYRAPEIMLSNERYTTAIDIWSIGCILAELIGGKPCFKGKDYIDQLNLILGVLGTPDMSTLNKVASEKAAAYIRSLPILPPRSWASILPDTVDPDALDLLDKLLAFDPNSRVSATDALSHPYMAQYHDPLDEPAHPEKFSKWEEVESLDTIEDLRSAITREIEEFREEVRNFGVYSDADEEEEQEVLADSASATVSGQVAMTRSPVPVEQVSPKDTARAQLGVGLSPTMATRRLPGTVGSPTTPATALSEDSAITFSSSAGPPPSATVGPGATSGSAPAPKKRSSSGYSMSRRPTSFLFSPLGYGMTPLPSLMPPETGSTGSVPIDPPPTGLVGRKSRQSSSTIPDAGSLRPLIRQLSTVNFHAASHGHGDDKEEEGEVPPMTVSPSDAPPSEVPRTQREASFAL